jgi:lipoprotein-releasing system permease protein
VSFEFFISKRIVKNKTQDKKVSKPIVRISVISISLAIVVNLITLAIVTGFQNEIRKKITGFNSPLFISKGGSKSIFECDPIQRNNQLITEIKKIKQITEICPVSYKPGLLQSIKFIDTLKLINGNDSLIQRQEIFGVLMKGVSKSYNWDFIKKNLILGRLPKYNQSRLSNEIILSEKICTLLNYKLLDEIKCYFMKEQPLARRYKIVGIYRTGLEDYDKKIVFCDLREIQKLNEYSIASSIQIDDSLHNSNSIVCRAKISSDATNLLFDWGNGPDIYSGFYMNKLRDTTIRLILHELNYKTNKSIPIDTSFLNINVENPLLCVDISKNKDGTLKINQINDNEYSLTSKKGIIFVKSIPGTGNYENYIAGYEIGIDSWKNIKQAKEKLKEMIEMRPDINGQLLQISSVEDNETDLFAWLSFLDINVFIIIILMLVIGVINVGSAMLVIIVVRTNLIGILKAMGAKNWSIRKIFLYQAGYLIIKGLFFGNLIGLSICWLQSTFGLISLDPTIYYIDKVPIELTLINCLLINLITFCVCIVSLILPSYVVTRISPTKAIRFN